MSKKLIIITRTRYGWAPTSSLFAMFALLALTAATAATLSVDRMLTSERDGRPGTSMPAWRHALSDDEIDAIIAYINIAFQGD